MGLFKKIDENRHGPVVAAFSEFGRFRIGTIAKWHSLFIPSDWRGRELHACKTRNEARRVLQQLFDFERGQADEQSAA